MSAINQHRYKFYSNKELLKCPACNAPVENEFHVLFECVAYDDIRLKLPNSILRNRTYNSMITMLSNSDYNLSVSKYLIDMFERRKDYIT